MEPTSILVIKNAAQLVNSSSQGNPRRGKEMSALTILADAAMVIENGIISWIGPSAQLPAVHQSAQIIDASGKTVLPGLVDSHTHLVWAGSREAEFEHRLQGETYQEIAAAGRGINATVAQVRQAGKDDLKAALRRRLNRLLRFGVTTVEVKSGYGLNLADEVKCLEAIAELNAEGPLELVPTFLGAHAVPPEFRHDRSGYVEIVVRHMLPQIARQKLADFCDVFCETEGFSLAESARILKQARDLVCRLKVHADELTPLGGAELSARHGPGSVDHVLCVTEAGLQALAAFLALAPL